MSDTIVVPIGLKEHFSLKSVHILLVSEERKGEDHLRNSAFWQRVEDFP
jgi:hypothetical protein